MRSSFIKNSILAAINFSKGKISMASEVKIGGGALLCPKQNKIEIKVAHGQNRKFRKVGYQPNQEMTKPKFFLR